MNDEGKAKPGCENGKTVGDILKPPSAGLGGFFPCGVVCCEHSSVEQAGFEPGVVVEDEEVQDGRWSIGL